MLLTLSPAVLSAFDVGVGELCVLWISEEERRHGIPDGLLRAIACVETGGRVARCPWPWSVNVAGRPYVFLTRHKALSFVKQMQRAGVRNMDVGCMQINLKHHAQAFKTLEIAFAPKHNIRYAAVLLRKLYDRTGTWDKAVAAYHSGRPVFHNPYRQKVFSLWYKWRRQGFL